MFTLFFAHHVLNLNWYQTIFENKYTPYRVLQLSVDAMVFVAMGGLMVSGIILSQHVFAFLQIEEGKAFARTLHMLASYWGYVLMAFHLGLHWNLYSGLFRKRVKTIQLPSVPTTLLSIAGIAITAYGFYAFIYRELPGYMFAQILFVNQDYQESKFLLYLDYLAMLGSFVWIARNITKRPGTRSTEKKLKTGSASFLSK